VYSRQYNPYFFVFLEEKKKKENLRRDSDAPNRLLVDTPLLWLRQTRIEGHRKKYMN
jgi:hypothetical protein